MHRESNAITMPATMITTMTHLPPLLPSLSHLAKWVCLDTLTMLAQALAKEKPTTSRT
jgi:hypothetical protein